MNLKLDPSNYIRVRGAVIDVRNSVYDPWDLSAGSGFSSEEAEALGKAILELAEITRRSIPAVQELAKDLEIAETFEDGDAATYEDIAYELYMKGYRK